MKVPSKPLLSILEMVSVANADSVTVVPEDEGWQFYVRDPSNFMMIAATLNRVAFDEDYDENLGPFAISIDYLKEALSRADNIDMTVENGFMKIAVEGSKSKRRLYALDETPRVFPKIKLKNSVAVESDKLVALAKKRYWANASECELGLEIKISESQLTFSFETEREGYTDEIPVALSDLPNGEQTCHFTPSFLVPALRAIPKGIIIVITMETDKPIIVTANTEIYKIDIFVAPRIGD